MHDQNPHLVCLDELNLARIEHYLAPLLSLKEHHQDALTWPLYSAHQEGACLNGQHYPPAVPLSRNLLWMGTVNMDEASYGLTEKFLDRAAYIRLRPAPFADKPEATPPQEEQMIFPLAPPPPISLSAEELEFFNQLNRAARHPLLSWRTLDAIRLSMASAPMSQGKPLWDAKTAWDEHLAARVLSKFRGAGMEWESWRKDLPPLRQLLTKSPWGALQESLSVLKELESSKEPGFVF
jgi:hypothetical protein